MCGRTILHPSLSLSWILPDSGTFPLIPLPSAPPMDFLIICQHLWTSSVSEDSHHFSLVYFLLFPLVLHSIGASIHSMPLLSPSQSPALFPDFPAWVQFHDFSSQPLFFTYVLNSIYWLCLIYLTIIQLIKSDGENPTAVLADASITTVLEELPRLPAAAQCGNLLEMWILRHTQRTESETLGTGHCNLHF